MFTTISGFRPMLAAKLEDINRLKFPIMASPKLDGIRAVWWKGSFLSRSLKPIPNRAFTAAVNKVLGKREINGLDGELIYGAPRGNDVFNRTTRRVMTADAPVDDIIFYLFDKINVDKPFAWRQKELAELRLPKALFHIVPQYMCHTLPQLMRLEQETVKLGYEGLILRDPMGDYKQGRSTFSEGGMIKMKRFTDAEAEIIGFEERMHNANPQTRNALGYAERTSHKANQIPTSTLGSLVCRWTNGESFGIGTGFSDALRQEIWDNRPKFLGKLAKFKYQEVGTIEAPRMAVYLGIRED